MTYRIRNDISDKIWHWVWHGMIRYIEWDVTLDIILVMMWYDMICYIGYDMTSDMIWSVPFYSLIEWRVSSYSQLIQTQPTTRDASRHKTQDSHSNTSSERQRGELYGEASKRSPIQSLISHDWPHLQSSHGDCTRRSDRPLTPTRYEIHKISGGFSRYSRNCRNDKKSQNEVYTQRISRRSLLIGEQISRLTETNMEVWSGDYPTPYWEWVLCIGWVWTMKSHWTLNIHLNELVGIHEWGPFHRRTLWVPAQQPGQLTRSIIPSHAMPDMLREARL